MHLDQADEVDGDDSDEKDSLRPAGTTTTNKGNNGSNSMPLIVTHPISAVPQMQQNQYQHQQLKCEAGDAVASKIHRNISSNGVKAQAPSNGQDDAGCFRMRMQCAGSNCGDETKPKRSAAGPIPTRDTLTHMDAEKHRAICSGLKGGHSPPGGR